MRTPTLPLDAPPRPAAGSRWGLPLLLVAHLSRPRPGGSGSRAVLILPLVAFAAATALTLTVLAGVIMFLGWEGHELDIYPTVAGLAGAILVIPLLSLGAAAARLSAHRRDDRLATLRLLGATSGTVSAMTVMESAMIAFGGALLGTLLYGVGLPLVGLLSFGGAPIGAAALMLSPLVIVGVVAGMTALAALSAVLSVRRVVISPLGVRMRRDAPPLRRWHFVVAGAVILLAVGALQVMQAGTSLLVMRVTFIGGFAAGIGVLNLLGPLVIAAIARSQVKRVKTPERLIALRQVLESPAATWRQVGGVAVTCFVAVVAGSGLGLISQVPNGDLDEPSRVLFSDMSTGIVLTIAMSFLMVACSVGVGQAAAVYDRADLYRSLHLLGMPDLMVSRARRRAVLAPLRWTVIVSVLVAGVLVFPLVGLAVVLAPLSVLTIALSLVGGVGFVWLGVWATEPIVRAVVGAAE
ncbi:FtsX-like permease family protein [Klugiella xanthotipulae]|uniref:FtsX-like permease family protein n=1 Tax=Klugiella xanthotipulae TaxID=244735 RepID=A0A543I4I6_9MICO|nr:FtsX-like permease family protein [Klugiella xanthotipulae]TQM65495.1 FtsX-like permease family protein [Klugiella xanthotipulae]